MGKYFVAYFWAVSTVISSDCAMICIFSMCGFSRGFLFHPKWCENAAWENEPKQSWKNGWAVGRVSVGKRGAKCRYCHPHFPFSPKPLLPPLLLLLLWCCCIWVTNAVVAFPPPQFPQFFFAVVACLTSSSASHLWKFKKASESSSCMRCVCVVPQK